MLVCVPLAAAAKPVSTALSLESVATTPAVESKLTDTESLASAVVLPYISPAKVSVNVSATGPVDPVYTSLAYGGGVKLYITPDAIVLEAVGSERSAPSFLVNV